MRNTLRGNNIMNNKEIKSDWWFFSNITLASIGVGFILFLIVILVGLIFTITIPERIVVTIIFLIWAISVYCGIKVVSLNASVNEKDIIKIFIYNLLLYLVLMLRVVPFIVNFVNISMNGLAQNFIIPIILGLIMSGFITLLVYNNSGVSGSGSKVILN